MKRGFIPNHNKGMINFSFIKGLSKMSTNNKHRLKAVPEIPEVIRAKENDHLFLHTGSPIAESPPTRMREPESKNHY